MVNSGETDSNTVGLLGVTKTRQEISDRHSSLSIQFGFHLSWHLTGAALNRSAALCHLTAQSFPRKFCWDSLGESQLQVFSVPRRPHVFPLTPE
jgi:hypothetical protein